MNAKRTKELIDKMIDFRRELIDKALIVNNLIDEVAMANGIANEDVVKVIRCRDCRWYSFHDKQCRRGGHFGRKGDDFCSYGEESPMLSETESEKDNE